MAKVAHLLRTLQTLFKAVESLNAISAEEQLQIVAEELIAGTTDDPK